MRLLAELGHEVVEALGSADLLLEAVIKYQPDLTIVDVRMPPSFTDEGLRAALQIRRQLPEASVLVLSQYVEERYAQELIASGSQGVEIGRAHV